MSNEKKIGIVTQARMSSTRLPGKVMMQVKGRPLLSYHIERCRASGLQNYIATTDHACDDPIVQFCVENEVPYYRGSETDVLSRYAGCAEQYGLDIIIRVTSDCPLIDGQLINKHMQLFLQLTDAYAYASNGLTETFPRGFDFEIFSSALLTLANREATTDYEREHVTPFMYENTSHRIRKISIENEEDKSNLRLTVDTIEDFTLIKKLIEEYGCDTKTIHEILYIMDTHKELPLINKHIAQKKK